MSKSTALCPYFGPNRLTIRTTWADSRKLYSVQIDHLSHDQLRSFIDFLELVYGSRVNVAPKNTREAHWLDIEEMRLGEAGLRVASRLYQVPFERLASQD